MTSRYICGIIFKSQGASCGQQPTETAPSARSGCGAVGSALPWGGRGRKFKSCHSDQVTGGCKSSGYLYFTRVFRTFGCGIFLYRAPKNTSENSEKSSWYIIWYIGSNGTFHRSVEANAKIALKAKDFPHFLGTKFSAKNAKGAQKRWQTLHQNQTERT